MINNLLPSTKKMQSMILNEGKSCHALTFIWGWRQLHRRQEKALQNYTDAESKISQMLSCHANETHVLRERLRRTRERERAAERRLKEKEEQLLRSHATVGRMKKLVEQRELGAREELSCKLDQERTRTHEAELKMKVPTTTRTPRDSHRQELK